MEAPASGASIFFDGFRLDCNGLFRVAEASREEPVMLGSRALDLLWLLATRHREIVSKDAIMEAVWPGQAVEDSNLTVQISALRRALDKDGQRSLIQNVPGRGYRFAAAVTQADAATDVSALALPDKPSIAVLPFTNLSGDPEQEYFCDGMVEEIITALSRIRWLFVIARNSSFTYKGQAVDVTRIGRELGVRYVLEGSVRKAGSQLRITAQLIEAETGSHLWADRFDGSLENVFDLQDQIAISVAGIIEPTLRTVEIRRSIRLPTRDLSAYDLYLRALHLGRSMAKDRLMLSIELLRRAIEQDPEYGPALALLANSHYRMDIQGWAGDEEGNRQSAADLSRRALQAAPDDPEVLGNAAFVLGYFGEDINTAVALIERALAVNPSYARGWYYSGILMNWAGRPENALDHFPNASRLNPRDYSLPNRTAVGIALFFCRRFDEAAAEFLEALGLWPDYTLNYRFLASSYAHMGRLDDARAVVARLRTITSTVLENGTRFRNPEYRELYLSGLRLAVGEQDQEGPPSGKPTSAGRGAEAGRREPISTPSTACPE